MRKISSLRIGDKSSVWKGDDVCYNAIHVYIQRWYGKADCCSNPMCSKKSTYFEWCKIDHTTPYTKNIEEFQKLCRVCHRGYDNGKLMINGKYGNFPFKTTSPPSIPQLSSINRPNVNLE
jgi:hypothetical protein